MGSWLASFSLRGVARNAAVTALDASFTRRGYERVWRPSDVEPNLVRAAVATHGYWTTCTIEEEDDHESIAKSISKAVGCLAIASYYGEDDSISRLTLFARGEELGELELPRDATRVEANKIEVPLKAFSRLVGDGTRSELALRIPTSRSDVIYVSQEEATTLFRRAFALSPMFLDPGLEEDVITYRPKVGLKVGQRGRAQEAVITAERRAAHDARIFAVGWLAFEAKPNALPKLLQAVAEPLATIFEPQLDGHALSAHRVDPGEGGATTLIEIDWKTFPALLKEGALIELRSSPVIASIGLTFLDGVFAVSWSLRGPKDSERRAALATDIDRLVTTATAIPGCFGALVAAQKDALRIANRAFAYEYYRNLSEHALRPERNEARAPGWRTLIPGAGERKPPAGFVTTTTKAGLLVASSAPDPWSLEPKVVDRLEVWLNGSRGSTG